VIPDRKARDALSEFHDLTGSFMPQHHREGARTRSINHREVGMAKACGKDAHKHLSSMWGI
jgi:hypothetical protein